MPLSDNLKALKDRLLGRGASGAAGAGPAAEPPTPTAFLAPTPLRFGHYRVLRKIGQGGMGVVYAAHDDRLERTLAVKVIAKDGTDDTAIKRFLREARAAAAVNLPRFSIAPMSRAATSAGDRARARMSSRRPPRMLRDCPLVPPGAANAGQARTSAC